jgi:uncharacterized membrane protein
MRAYLVDILAVGFFIIEWTVYAVTLEHSAYGRDSLSARMHVYREIWIRRMLDRETRMILIFIYAFFKFAWAYRLFNYVAILIGAMPQAKQRDTPEAEAHVIRTTRLFEAAGRHFNRGQRAFFFALGYLGWFVSPWILFITTAAVVIVTWRRQFASNAWRAMGS